MDSFYESRKKKFWGSEHYLLIVACLATLTLLLLYCLSDEEIILMAIKTRPGEVEGLKETFLVEGTSKFRAYRTYKVRVFGWNIPALGFQRRITKVVKEYGKKRREW